MPLLVYSKQPTWNVKCIVLTLFLALAYWYLPHRNKWVLLSITLSTYVALAWYDHMYACKRNMGPTYLTLFYWWLKPPESKAVRGFHTWDPVIKQKVLFVDLIVLFAVLLCAPAFMKWTPESGTPKE